MVDGFLRTVPEAAIGHLDMPRGARDVRLVCLVAAPEGLAAVRDAEPALPSVAGAVNRGLDERGFIRPGPGDAGDRIFGTE